MKNDSTAGKHPNPKILLVDLPAEATERLTAAGFNAHAGTFGRPYRVPVGDDFLPVPSQWNLPNHTEQDVVIIDLTPPEAADQPAGRKMTSRGTPDWYARSNRGYIDPRARAMRAVSDDWGRILDAGGAFVVFAQPRRPQDFVFGHVEYEVLEVSRQLLNDNWSFLRVLDAEHLEVASDQGVETRVLPSAGHFAHFLHGHQPGLRFEAVVAPEGRLGGVHGGFVYLPLIVNKFGGHVGAAVLAKGPAAGCVVILPQVADKAKAVYELVTSVLPEMCRHLFPSHAGGRWVHGGEYEHPAVLERQREQTRVRLEADARVEALEREIEAERVRLSFLHGLLTNQDDALVDDVKAALSWIGFAGVKSPDEESGGGKNKQEDLQILDRWPRLLVEVKGLAAFPGEADAIQVTKYVMRRMQEWGRTEVSGVFLVNHQRNLPALGRDHANVFTGQQMADALAYRTGLMTTWDLFRLVRGMIRWGWPGAAVQDVFYGKGRLPSVPSHYAVVGEVAHFYDRASAVSVRLIGSLRVGDTVGYLLPAGFFEEPITSLQMNKVAIQEGSPGQQVGYKTALSRKDLPDRTPIYVVRQSHAGDAQAAMASGDVVSPVKPS